MMRKRQWLRRRGPAVVAVAAGAVAGLGAAAATAAPVQAAWQDYVLPAFSRLLGTLAAFC